MNGTLFMVAGMAEQHPEEYRRLLDLGRGLYEASRFMLTDNVRE